MERIRFIRVFCCLEQPNGKWDGFRIAIFDFSVGVPGEIVWPESGTPKWVIPNIDENFAWCDFDVLWVAYPYRSVVAAQEQFFDWPECDAACFDDYGTVQAHTWFKTSSAAGWARYEGPNLMLRLVLDVIGRVDPSSLGRIKALYR